MKEASIERNIVKYEDVNIIGENIETIKENISKLKERMIAVLYTRSF